MTDVKPLFTICFILADVIAKVPVADLIAKFMAHVTAIEAMIEIWQKLVF